MQAGMSVRDAAWPVEKGFSHASVLHTREDHRDIRPVCRIDDLSISDGAARSVSPLLSFA